MSVEEFIASVQKCPSLWNMRHIHYHNKLMNERLWSKIAEEWNGNANDMKKKWKSLKDAFNREYKKIPTPRSGDSASSAPVYKGKWPYFQAMLFVRDMAEPRQTSSNLHTMEESTSSLEEYPQDEEQGDETEFFDNLSVSALADGTPEGLLETTPAKKKCESDPVYVKPQTVRPSKKKRKQNLLSAFETELLKKEEQKLDLLKGTDDDNDDDLNFFKSLLPYFKNMTPIQKLKLRSRIQNMVIEELECGLPQDVLILQSL